MQTWVAPDDRGRQYLVRTGTGVVTAVTPVGIVGPDGHHPLYRVEIQCDTPRGRPRAIRYSVHPLVPSGGAVYNAALEAWEQVWPVGWTVEWHRHDWIPDDLPIGALDLVTDARSVLVGLDRFVLPESVENATPDFVPASWQGER